MIYKICFQRLTGNKRLYVDHGQAYEVIIKTYFKGMEKRPLEWLISKFGAYYCDASIFEKYYTVYQQEDLFNAK
jgi:hypothetical protein